MSDDGRGLTHGVTHGHMTPCDDVTCGLTHPMAITSFVFSPP
jgi:hypothetical protein